MAMARDESKAKLKVLFESLDIDGNGQMTKEEWSGGLEANSDILAEYFGDTTKEENEEV